MKLLTSMLVFMLLLPLGMEPSLSLAAQGSELDCTTFASFEEANDFYLENPDAGELIDDDGDGVACEVYFGLEVRGQSPSAEPVGQGAPPAPNGAVELAQTAEDDLDCEDFAFQEDAQDVLDADPDDPHNLDPNGDGIACALLPSLVDAAPEADVESAQTAEDERAQRQAEREARRAARQADQNGGNAQAGQADAAPSVTCENFATREDAQAAFDEDPEGLAALDADGNGIACEELIADVAIEEPAAETDRQERRQNRRDRNQQDEVPVETVVDEPRRGAPREDLDCIDFEFQEDAQAVYNEDPTDPFNLDPNGDGFACSSLPMREPLIVQVPRTGSGAGATLAFGAVAAASLLAGLGAFAVGQRRTRP